MDNSISIIIPAYNEEKHIVDTLNTVLEGCCHLKNEHEIIVVNDGSSDKTGELVARFIQSHPEKIRLVNNPKNLGFGGAYRQGVLSSKMNYVTLVAGDNSITSESVTSVCEKAGLADVMITYVTNPGIRKFKRRFLSRLFVFIINATFGYRIKYYNGHNIFPTRMLKEMETFTSGFFFSSQIIIRLLKAGATYAEIPMEIRDRSNGEGSALKPNNVFVLVRDYLRLVDEVYFGKRFTKTKTLLN